MNLLDFYKGKRVLITGHTGFKGSWLTQILLDAGATVCGYSLVPNTAPSLFEALELGQKAENHFEDIRDFKKFTKVVGDFQPDIIFHLAAQPIVRDSYDNPLYTYETNVMGTANVLEAIRENRIKVGIIITTDKVYENKERDHAYVESDPLGGYDPYANSKACADLIVSSYIDSFFNPEFYGDKHQTLIASARAGNVIGGGDWAKDRLVSDIMRAFFEKNEEVVIRSPKAIRPWQHVLEPLSGYLELGRTLLEGKKKNSGAWNFGPKKDDMKEVSFVLEEFIRVLQRGKFRIEADTSKHESGILKLSSGKAQTQLSWKPNLVLAESIKMTADWYREFYQGSDIRSLTAKQINEYFGVE
jgi:CDP-glucose 4,6-dehydratase